MKNVFKSGWAYLSSLKKALASGPVIAVMVFGLSCLFGSCSKSNDLQNALPEDAIAVGRVDFDKLSKGDNLLSDILKLYVSEDQIKETGVDVKTPAYAFAYENFGGCVFALRDEDSFFKYIKVNAESQRGLKWADYNGICLIASDGKRAMVVGPANTSDQDNMRNKVCKWMEQTKCPVSKEIMKAVGKGEGFLTVAASLDKLPSEITREYEKLGVDMSGLAFYADLALARKEIALTMGSVGTNEYMEKTMKLNPASRIDGSLAGAFGNRPFAQAEYNVNGEKFLKYLETTFKQVPEFKQGWEMLNSMVGVDSFIKSLDGEAAFVMPEFSLRGIPNMLLTAKVNNEKFMKDVDKWNDVLSQQGGMQLVPFRENVYEVKGIGLPMFFGTQNKQLVFTTDKDMLDATPKGKSALPKEAKGSYGYICVDLSSTGLWDMLWRQYPLLNLVPEKVAAFKEFNRLLFVVEDATRVRLSLGTWE